MLPNSRREFHQPAWDVSGAPGTDRTAGRREHSVAVPSAGGRRPDPPGGAGRPICEHGPSGAENHQSPWLGPEYFYFQSYRQLLRELRIASYLGDLVEMQGLLAVCAKNYPEDLAQYPPWLLIFNNPFDADSLRALPDELLGEALTAIFAASVRHFEPAPALLALAESLLAENRCADLVRYYLAEQALLRGDSAQAGTYLNAFSPGHPTDYAETLRGWVAFLQGADEVAITHYETALKLLRKRTGKRKIFFDSLSGVFYILALLAVGTPGCLRQALLAMAPVFDKRTCPAYPSLYGAWLGWWRYSKGKPQRQLHRI